VGTKVPKGLTHWDIALGISEFSRSRIQAISSESSEFARFDLSRPIVGGHVSCDHPFRRSGHWNRVEAKISVVGLADITSRIETRDIGDPEDKESMHFDIRKSEILIEVE
jgi:hypothetical protein